MIKKLLNKLTGKKESESPKLKGSFKKNRFFIAGDPPKTAMSIIAECIQKNLDLEALKENLSKEDFKQFWADYKGFISASKTLGNHKGNRAARNKSKVIRFMSALCDNHLKIKIKK